MNILLMFATIGIFTLILHAYILEGIKLYKKLMIFTLCLTGMFLTIAAVFASLGNPLPANQLSGTIMGYEVVEKKTVRLMVKEPDQLSKFYEVPYSKQLEESLINAQRKADASGSKDIHIKRNDKGEFMAYPTPPQALPPKTINSQEPY